MGTLLILALVLVALAFGAGRLLGGPDLSRYDRPAQPPVITPADVSPEHQDVLAQLHQLHADSPPARDIAARRAQLEELFSRDVEAAVAPVDAGSVPAEWVTAEDAAPDHRLLFLHGGALRLGSPASHRGLASDISRHAGVAVLSIDYRLMPEHTVADAIDDCRVAYRWIQENGPLGASPSRGFFMAGDSAGGYLALILLAWARDAGLRPVDAAVALSPATSITFGSPSFRSNVPTDPFLGPAVGSLARMPRLLLLLSAALTYRTNPSNPAYSPILGDLAGLPPLLLQVSEQELVIDDVRRYANKAIEAGSPVTLQTWPTMVHVWQAFAPALPEAVDAIERIGNFIDIHKPEA